MTTSWSVRQPMLEQSKPEGWTVRRIGDLVWLVNGHPFLSTGFDAAGDFPLVRIRDLLAYDFETYVSGRIPSSAMIQNGDIVIGMDGDFNLVRWRRGHAALNQRLCALRPQDDVDIRFVAYALLDALRVINDLTYSTTVKHLSSADVLAERIILPPLDEQRRVADFLDFETARTDRLVELQNSMLNVLSQRREGIVLAEVAGFSASERHPSRLAWTDELPANWRTVKLSFVARMGSGHTPSRSRPEWWIDCTVPWITTGEVSQVRDDRQEIISETRESISRLGMANSSAELHPAGTVVLCRTASAGYSAVMGRDMATSQDFVTWTCGKQLDPFYLLWCLRAMRSDLLGRLAIGSTHKTIYIPDLQMLKIPLPSLVDQLEVVERIRRSNRRIDALVDSIKAQLALLAERRQALITAAVTGQFDVTTARGADLS